MSYFKKVKQGDKVFCLIFGLGIINEIFNDGEYKLRADFDDGFKILFTDEGIPTWGKLKNKHFFIKEI